MTDVDKLKSLMAVALEQGRVSISDKGPAETLLEAVREVLQTEAVRWRSLASHHRNAEGEPNKEFTQQAIAIHRLQDTLQVATEYSAKYHL